VKVKAAVAFASGKPPGIEMVDPMHRGEAIRSVVIY